MERHFGHGHHRGWQRRADDDRRRVAIEGGAGGAAEREEPGRFAAEPGETGRWPAERRGMPGWERERRRARAHGDDVADARVRGMRDAGWDEGREDPEAWSGRGRDPHARDAERAQRFEGDYDERTVERYRGTVDPRQYVGPDPYPRMRGHEPMPWSAATDARRAGRSRGPYAGRGPQGYRRSDDRIREDACERLTDDPWVDASDITVTVSGGEITLEGTVDDRRQKRHAEDCVEGVSGVTDVQNRLRVRRGEGAPEPMP
jgi:osmotically-inducible protein OsmY